MTNDLAKRLQSIKLEFKQRSDVQAFEERMALTEHFQQLFKLCLEADLISEQKAKQSPLPELVELYLLHEHQGFPATDLEKAEGSLSMRLAKSETDSGPDLTVHLPVADNFDEAQLLSNASPPERLGFEVRHSSGEIEALVLSASGLKRFIKNSDGSTKFDTIDTEFIDFLDDRSSAKSHLRRPLLARIGELANTLSPVLQRKYLSRPAED